MGDVDVLVVGDSIAAWGWPELLPGVVVNVAVPGARVCDLPDQMCDTRARLVVLSIGVNDVLRLGEPLDLSALAGCISHLTDHSGDLLLIRPNLLPIPGPHRAELTQRLRDVSMALRHISPLPGRRWPWHYQRDGLHLNALGHRAVAHSVRTSSHTN